MDSLENKVAIITGAASGIGKAIAEQCVYEKMKVVLADINEEALLQVEKELKQFTSNVISVVTDVSNPHDIKKLSNKAISSFNKVHVLFNNAGILPPLGAIWEVSQESLKRVIDVNLMSVIYGLREFIPIMLAQQDECYIVNTASAAGLLTHSNMSGYMATKHAVVALSEVLFSDLEQRKANIHVSVLCPCLVKTNICDLDSFKANAKLIPETRELADFFNNHIDKATPPDDIAKKVFAAIKNNQFYILTYYEEIHEDLKKRMNNILLGQNPSNGPLV